MGFCIQSSDKGRGYVVRNRRLKKGASATHLVLLSKIQKISTSSSPLKVSKLQDPIAVLPPSSPGAPLCPLTPGSPVGPCHPGGPSAPGAPTGPGGPGGPGRLLFPGFPAGPGGPCSPLGPSACAFSTRRDMASSSSPLMVRAMCARSLTSSPMTLADSLRGARDTQ